MTYTGGHRKHQHINFKQIERLSSVRFELGQIVATSGIIDKARECALDFSNFIARHLYGDWGDIGEEDKLKNNDIIKHNLQARLFSSYNIFDKFKLYIITESDRSITTLMLPEEY